MPIGTSWAPGTWVDDAWANGTWADIVPVPLVDAVELCLSADDTTDLDLIGEDETVFLLAGAEAIQTLIGRDDTNLTMTAEIEEC